MKKVLLLLDLDFVVACHILKRMLLAELKACFAEQNRTLCCNFRDCTLFHVQSNGLMGEIVANRIRAA